MTVRITGGALRGRVLREPVPKGVRPTSARVREALFSMIGQDLEGVRFLDAFGGAGLVGIEAASRGAEVTVVERDRGTLRVIARSGEALGLQWTLRAGDVLRIAEELGPFDVVFADPPYDADPVAVLTRLAVVRPAWMVLETDAATAVPEALEGFVCDRRRTYGGTALTVFRRGEDEA